MLVPVPDRCSGCGYCVMACCVAHGTPLTPARASLRLEKRSIEEDLVFVCTHGEGCDLDCIMACPVDAIAVSGTGAVVVDKEVCIACGSCAKACPYGVIWFDDRERANKCDLCGGDPACVRYCLLDAIEYREATEADFEALRRAMEVGR